MEPVSRGPDGAQGPTRLWSDGAADPRGDGWAQQNILENVWWHRLQPSVFINVINHNYWFELTQQINTKGLFYIEKYVQ